MGGQNYYRIAALPSLGPLGSEPPITGAELLEIAGDSTETREIIEAVLLGDDLTQRRAVLSGEIDEPEPTVLSVAQVKDEQPLPPQLAAQRRDDAQALPGDAEFEAYYRYVADLAERRHSRFLSAWVGFEVALRNALAETRAKRLELDPTRYMVAPDLAATDEKIEPILSEWSAAANPLDAQRALDRARWDWLGRHDEWFSFADDELAAYAAKLMLLHRWNRISRAEVEMPAPPGSGPTSERTPQ